MKIELENFSSHAKPPTNYLIASNDSPLLLILCSLGNQVFRYFPYFLFTPAHEMLLCLLQARDFREFPLPGKSYPFAKQAKGKIKPNLFIKR